MFFVSYVALGDVLDVLFFRRFLFPIDQVPWQVGFKMHVQWSGSREDQLAGSVRLSQKSQAVEWSRSQAWPVWGTELDGFGFLVFFPFFFIWEVSGCLLLFEKHGPNDISFVLNMR